MANAPTVGAISKMLANPSPASSSDVPDIVVQVIDLNVIENKYMFTANDGDMKIIAGIPSYLLPDAISGNIQNLGFIRVLDYSIISNPKNTDKYLEVKKCKGISPGLEEEVRTEVKKEFV